MAKWSIDIKKVSQGGYVPTYWKSDYPTYGNKNMLSAMNNVDLTSSDYITQGPGLSTLTDGTESGNVSTLIKGILETSQSDDTIYGVGGDTVYKITSSAVTAPRTISNGTNEDGEDVAIYDGDLFYSYNNDSGGTIGKYDISGDSWNDDWWTTTASGTALTDNPHPMTVAGTSGVLYIANGQYVAEWDGGSAYHDSFDTTDSDSTVVDLAWNQNRLWIAANKKNLTGSNRNEASIYVWDGNSDSWEDEIEIKGKIGALFIKSGTLFVFYKKNLAEDIVTLGYINGTQIQDVFNYSGSLPSYYQITAFQDFIIWLSGNDIFAFGSGDVQMDARSFQLANAGYSTTGGITNAFGKPIIASYDGSTSYQVSKLDSYSTDSSFKTISFNAQNFQEVDATKSSIESIWVQFEKLASGARVDMDVVESSGDTIAEKTISYSDDGAVIFKRFGMLGSCTDFRLEFDFSNGSTSNPVKIKHIKINGVTNA